MRKKTTKVLSVDEQERSRRAKRAKPLGTGLENRVVARAQAKGIPAKKQPGSGIYRDFKSDVVLAQRWLVECKVRSATVNAKGQKTLSIEFEHLAKVTREAAADGGYEHALLVENAKGSAQPLVVVTLDHYLTLLAAVHTRILPITAISTVFDRDAKKD